MVEHVPTSKIEQNPTKKIEQSMLSPYFFDLTPINPTFSNQGHCESQIFGRKAIITPRSQ